MFEYEFPIFEKKSVNQEREFSEMKFTTEFKKKVIRVAQTVLYKTVPFS